MNKFEINELKKELVRHLEMKKQAVDILTRGLNIESTEIFYKYIKGELPESGILLDGNSFFFHGLGCSVNIKALKKSVDLEFGPNGQVLAFDKGTICHILGQMSKCDVLIKNLEEENIIALADQRLYEILCSGNREQVQNEYEDIDLSVADRYILV